LHQIGFARVLASGHATFNGKIAHQDRGHPLVFERVAEIAQILSDPPSSDTSTNAGFDLTDLVENALQTRSIGASMNSANCSRDYAPRLA